MVAALWLARIAFRYSPQDCGRIPFVGQSSCVDDGNVQSDPDAIHVVPGLDVVEGHDDKPELSEEGDL